MKKYFYIGLTGLALFEILNVYFIMPMPGSQKMNSIDVAYFLYSWRWVFRIFFLALTAISILKALRVQRKWIPVVVLILTSAVVYLFNFVMTADKMFLQPRNLVLKTQSENKIPGNRLVIGLVHNGVAKAYPVGFLAYHHQVLDEVGGKRVIVTYCNVCRTGRVFEPMVNGKLETFRLVGMDHFNAMFEDETTRSWWRQVNGEAITGALKGQRLPEVASWQMTVEKWYALYPDGLVMQPDEVSISKYDSLARFEHGKSEGSLTRTDSLSWLPKSWVVGIKVGETAKAYDWQQLKKSRIIHDRIGPTDIVLALSADGQSFAAFERPSGNFFIIDEQDVLHADSLDFNFAGRSLSSSVENLKPIKAYQEYWHSWKTFHPHTGRYSK